MNEREVPRPDQTPLIPRWAAPAYLWVSIFAGLAYGALDLVVVSMPGMAVAKTLAVGLLAVYAGLSRAPILMLALVLSACGDFALAMSPPAREAGMAFFGGAHLAYIALFALVIIQRGFRPDGLILTVALLAFGAAMYVWLSPGMGELRGPVSAYLTVIVLMASLAALMDGPRLVTLGALLFVISDAMIAAGWFRGLSVRAGGWDIMGAAIWFSYYFAQLALALGVVRLKRADIEEKPAA